MKKICILATVAVLLFGVSAVQADILTANYYADGDAALTCTAYAGGTDKSLLEMYGDQHSGPAHLLGNITTDSSLDPTITVHNTIDNDTGFAWTGYQVNIYLSYPFTVFNQQVFSPLTPSGWSVSPLGTITAAWDGTEYKATLNYTGGTPVAYDPNPLLTGSFEFGYKINFSGATQYAFCQEMIPVPEPATMVLLALAGLAGLLFLRRK
jgi:hypothetical protein